MENSITESIMYKDLPQIEDKYDEDEEEFYNPSTEDSLSITFNKTLDTEKRYRPEKPIELCPPKEYDINKENEGTESQEKSFKLMKIILNFDLILSIFYIIALTSLLASVSLSLERYLLIYPLPFLIPSSWFHFFYIMDIQYFPTKRQINGVVKFSIFFRLFSTFLLVCLSFFVSSLISNEPEMVKKHILEKLGFKESDLWGMGIIQFQLCCLLLSIALFSESVAIVYFWCQISRDEENLNGEDGIEMQDDGINYTNNRLRGRL